MKITSALFEAYLKCPTKCFLRARGERGDGNAYAEWVQAQSDSYRSYGIARLMEDAGGEGSVLGPTSTEVLDSPKWRFAVDVEVHADLLESRLHAVERVPAQGRQGATQLIPFRFVTANKLTRHDKLLLAFDALVLSESLRCEVGPGKILHGQDRSIVTVKPAPLVREVRTLTGHIGALLSNPSPPDLILNRHCAECEYRDRCRQLAGEKDDLSLLAGMTEKERQRHNSKGIFTVTQLSYTFRPRRAPKWAKHPATPHYQALQALAIRENTVYIHGKPRLPGARTQVYLDIEGLPGREFYYLIGALVVCDGEEIYHSFWADTAADEPSIFAAWADAVCGLPDVQFFHFGAYEATALKRIRARLPESLRSNIDAMRDRATNVLSVVHPHLYFPTYSNGLKELGRFLGYERTDEKATGLHSIIWRNQWDASKDPALKASLLRYNEDDCRTVKCLCDVIARIAAPDGPAAAAPETLPPLVHTEEMQKDRPRWDMFRPREYASDDFKHVSKCAYFDYQREKVLVRTHPRFRTVNKRHRKFRRTSGRRNSVQYLESQRCPRCRSKMIDPLRQMSHDVVDLKFFKGGVKKWITRLVSWGYRCAKCHHRFNAEGRLRSPRKCGHALMSWCAYANIVCGLNMGRVRKVCEDLFGLFLGKDHFFRSKDYFAGRYRSLYAELLQAILTSPVIHIDETTVKLHRERGYVWVLTSMDKVYYLYRSTREGGFLEEMLRPFAGILVADFFTAYDSLPCEHQKCLVHLVRDMDEDLLRNPLDVELKGVAQEFGGLLRTIIATVDRYGLKRRHLHKHRRAAIRFLEAVGSQEFSSERANKYKKRFQKSGSSMFTFLDHDGVPWNNTNAEHAIKRFAKYRRDADGLFTERSLEEYLVLASVFETCEFNNVNVLKFLLSKEESLQGLFGMAGRGSKTNLLQTQVGLSRGPGSVYGLVARPIRRFTGVPTGLR